MIEREINYRAIRRRVILRWINRLLFVVNALWFYYTMNLMDFSGNASRMVAVAWLFVLVAHFLWAFGIISGFIQSQTEREAERLRGRGYTVIAPDRAVESLRAQGYTVIPPDREALLREKPKRAARLTDDGEIDYDDETYDDVPARRSRAHE